jgi:hypothetical protein
MLGDRPHDGGAESDEARRFGDGVAMKVRYCRLSLLAAES